MSCPRFEDLLELLRGQISQEKRAAIDLHLSTGCKICAENYDWLKNLLTITAQDDSFEFSEETLAWSVAQFKVASATSSPGTLLAQLVFDSLAGRRPAEVRAGSPVAASGRQMLFQAGIYDIDLRLEPQEETKGIAVIGQILSSKKQPAEVAGLAVRLAANGGTSGNYELRTETNARGMFHLTDLVPSDYELEVDVPEGKILIRGISSPGLE